MLSNTLKAQLSWFSNARSARKHDLQSTISYSNLNDLPPLTENPLRYPWQSELLAGSFDRLFNATQQSAGWHAEMLVHLSLFAAIFPPATWKTRRSALGLPVKVPVH